MEAQEITRIETRCPVCGEACFAAAGRGYCPECSITFGLKQTRKQLMQAFLEKYYMSKASVFYHRPGCKYLKNVSPENLIEVSEPSGKPCRCVR